LLEKAKKVVAIELDSKMIGILNKRFAKSSNFELLNSDVLKTNLKEIIAKLKQEGIETVKVVANLPYYITTPIIMKLLEERLNLKTITVMVQKEVAQRLTALPGKEYTGAITYAINYYSEAQTVLEVPRQNFLPSPEVDSSVILLKILEKPSVEVKNEEEFFKLIKIAFMQKRKTLVNSLENGKIAQKKQIEEALLKLRTKRKNKGRKTNATKLCRLAKNALKKLKFPLFKLTKKCYN